MDLADYEAAVDAHEAGVRVEIVDPVTGEPVGAAITLCGPDSRRAKIARTAAIRGAILRGGDKLDDAAQADVATELLARCVISWEGIQRSGSDIPLTLENAVMVFTRFPWIETQCDRKASDRANFTPG